MGSCIDLRNLQDGDAIQDAFSKVVSGGKMGYKTVIERKKIIGKGTFICSLIDFNVERFGSF